MSLRIEEFIYKDHPVKIIYKRIRYSYLRVKAPGTIEITTSLRTPAGFIYQLLDKYYGPLQTKLNALATTLTRNDLLNGTSINYLSNSYRLDLVNNSKKAYGLSSNTLQLAVTNFNDQDLIYHEVINWYHSEGIRLAHHLLKKHFNYFAARGFVVPQIIFKLMRSQWGSYSLKTHKVCLNLALLQFDIKYLEYVIVHELCHIIELNHSSKFYALLDKLLPGWAELRMELKKLNPLFMHNYTRSI